MFPSTIRLDPHCTNSTKSFASTHDDRRFGRICIVGLGIVLAAAATLGCQQPTDPAASAPREANSAPPPTNRVDINTSVRKNLGITFAKVENRAVSRTLRVPGRFELLLTARREYRVPVAGKIELLVQQYQAIETGTPLFRLDSPRWRELQAELAEAEARLRQAEAGSESIGPLIEALENRLAASESAVALWQGRVETLDSLKSNGGVRGADVAEAKGSLVDAQSALAESLEKQAELIAKKREIEAQLNAAGAKMSILLAAAASFSGRTAADLMEFDGTGPRWKSISQIDVVALSPGVIETIDATSGSYVDENATVLTSVQPEQVCFRAHGLQSDMGKLVNGMGATVVAPSGGSFDASNRIEGTVILAPTADPERRTIQLIMTPNPPQADATATTWARAGVSAFLELVVDDQGPRELAIPLSSVVKDGLQSIIFRRDPKDPNKAIRMDADLGIDDGRWVVIKSGVAEGDEVVLDGVYQLMVATSGSITKGGHFHPDGTFHEGNE